MKTTHQQYELFKSECLEWIKVFELSGFEFRFFWDEIDNRAEVKTEQVNEGIIEIHFSKEWKNTNDIDNINEYIKRVAKHEMIHCFLAEFSEAGWDRFTTKDEMIKLGEKLVNKLINLV